MREIDRAAKIQLEAFISSKPRSLLPHSLDQHFPMRIFQKGKPIRRIPERGTGRANP